MEKWEQLIEILLDESASDAEPVFLFVNNLCVNAAR